MSDCHGYPLVWHKKPNKNLFWMYCSEIAQKVWCKGVGGWVGGGVVQESSCSGAHLILGYIVGALLIHGGGYSGVRESAASLPS